jgi:hypothetical protein
MAMVALYDLCSLMQFSDDFVCNGSRNWHGVDGMVKIFSAQVVG